MSSQSRGQVNHLSRVPSGADLRECVPQRILADFNQYWVAIRQSVEVLHEISLSSVELSKAGSLIGIEVRLVCRRQIRRNVISREGIRH